MACKREILQERMLGNGPRKDENVVQTENLVTRGPEMKENKAVPDIIIIDDDDSGEGENCNTSEDVELCEGDDESDAGSRSHRLYHSTQPRCYGVHNRCGSRDLTKPGPSQLSWCLHRRSRKGEKRPVQIAFDNNIGESSSSSDCEIIEDVGGKFRREWEEASLRKQLGKAQSCQAESEESTTVTNTTSSLARRRLQREGKFQYQETSPSVQGRSDPCQSGSSIPSFQKGSDEDENRFAMPKLAVFYDQQDSNDFAKSISCSDSADDLSKDISSSFENVKDAFNEGTSSPHLKSLTVESNNDNMSGGKGNYFRGVGNNELRNQRFEAQGSSALRSIAKAGEALQHTKQEDWALWQDGQCQRKKCKVDAKEKNITKGKSKRK